MKIAVLDASIQFVYVQTVTLLNGVLHLNLDVTGLVPHQMTEGVLIIL